MLTVGTEPSTAGQSDPLQRLTRGSHDREQLHFHRPANWPVAKAAIIPVGMGEYTPQRIGRRPPIARKRRIKRTAETMGRRLLEIVTYDKSCRIGGTLNLDDRRRLRRSVLEMPVFKTAVSFAVSQGWVIVEDDTLTLRAAGPARA